MDSSSRPDRTYPDSSVAGPGKASHADHDASLGAGGSYAYARTVIGTAHGISHGDSGTQEDLLTAFFSEGRAASRTGPLVR